MELAATAQDEALGGNFNRLEGAFDEVAQLRVSGVGQLRQVSRTVGGEQVNEAASALVAVVVEERGQTGLLDVD